jgi:hypothetical protein
MLCLRLYWRSLKAPNSLVLYFKALLKALLKAVLYFKALLQALQKAPLRLLTPESSRD